MKRQMTITLAGLASLSTLAADMALPPFFKTQEEIIAVLDDPKLPNCLDSTSISHLLLTNSPGYRAFSVETVGRGQNSGTEVDGKIEMVSTPGMAGSGKLEVEVDCDKPAKQASTNFKNSVRDIKSILSNKDVQSTFGPERPIFSVTYASTPKAVTENDGCNYALVTSDGRFLPVCVDPNGKVQKVGVSQL